MDKARDAPGGTAAKILDTAEAVFAEVGFAAASTREIARRAGVRFGAMHYHWGSKQLLWQGVCRRLCERARATLLENLRPGRTPEEILDNVTDAFLEMMISHRNHTRLVCRTFLDDPRDAEVRRMSADLTDLGLGILRDLAPSPRLDAKLAVFLMSTAFVAAVANESAQEELLDGSVFTSEATRERLRSGLKTLVRATFGNPGS